MNYNGSVTGASNHILIGRILIVVALLFATGTSADVDGKRVLGGMEAVRIEPEGILVVALLDTGASTTSLDARAIRVVERDGKPWVEFEYHEDERVTMMARPLVRMSRLRTAPGVTEQRPVVMMRICIGNSSHEVQVNLVDRSKLRSHMLIGRNMLIRGQFVVDPALKLTTPPFCDGTGK